MGLPVAPTGVDIGAMRLQLFGSLTSPYARRVRIVLAELDQPFEWTDTTTDAGQAALRATTPLWKVPVAVFDGEAVFDSAVINQRLLLELGFGGLAPIEATDWHTRNIITAIDGLLDSLINTFYLGKEGITLERAPYLRKQTERAAASAAWLEEQLVGPWLTVSKSFGLPEIALLTALDWMRLRAMYPVENHPPLMQFLAFHAERPSVHTTKPPV
jgi:glutathione S-transferase